MANIYKKLPEDIQYIIDEHIKNNIKFYVKSDVLIQVKQRRKKNITEFINMLSKDLLYSFYYWIIVPDRNDPAWFLGYNDRSKYTNFFKKLFPSLTDISTINMVYKYYSSITGGDETSFINLCIDNISIEEAEDLYNYTLFTFYLTKINYSPLVNPKKEKFLVL